MTTNVQDAVVQTTLAEMFAEDENVKYYLARGHGSQQFHAVARAIELLNYIERGLPAESRVLDLTLYELRTNSQLWCVKDRLEAFIIKVWDDLATDQQDCVKRLNEQQELIQLSKLEQD